MDQQQDAFEFDAYLCHAPEDRDRARELVRSLQAAGLRVWFAEEQILPGHNRMERMEQGLQKSRRGLVCLSRSLPAARWAHQEWYALLYQQIQRDQHRVVTALLDEIPEPELPLLLQPLAREDLWQPQGLARVIAALRPQPVAPPPPPALPAAERRLWLRGAAAGLMAAWLPALAPGAAPPPAPPPADDPAWFPLASPLSAEQARDIRWYLEDYLHFPGAGDRVRAAAIEADLARVGRDLHRGLSAAGGDAVLAELSRGHGLLTLISEDADALALPFELLRDGQGALLLRGLRLRRLLPGLREPAAPRPGLPLRVLLVTARPREAGFIDPRASARPLLEALEPLRGLTQVEVCDPPTLEELARRLAAARRQQRPFHIVHFDGHGVYDRARGVGLLCFEDAEGGLDKVPGPRLGELLSEDQIPLVVLEACQTADLGGQPVFSSVAPALLRGGVGSVVAFSHAVLVTAAQRLVSALYQALAAGDRVGAALAAARKALHRDPARLELRDGEKLELQDWHIAQLYQGGADPQLLPVGVAQVAPEPAPPPGRALDPALPPPPRYQFQGRARELEALRRLLRARGAVLLAGMGGMGKTSLAVEAARWWHKLGLRPGGVCFFSFESGGGVEAAVLALGVYLEGPEFRRWDEAERRRRVVRAFRERELLWIWDNFESALPRYRDGDEGERRAELAALAGLCRELTAPGARGWLLVTCRPDEAGLGELARLPLAGLSEADALALALRILDQRRGLRAGVDRAAVVELLALLGHHPLSLELVLPHLGVIGVEAAALELRARLSRFQQGDAPEGRNGSLLASLAFSTARLSAEAQAVLPYLAWFQGGAFEAVILAFAGIAPEVWERIRVELLGTALAREDGEVTFADRPYLHFHPTLPYAADPGAVPAGAEAERRFLQVYWGLAAAVDRAFRGPEPAVAMKVMAREEANLRQAALRAFARGDAETGAGLADTIGSYLTSAGRAREREQWAARVHGLASSAPRGPAAWNAERDHAEGLAAQGRWQEAVALLERQREEIRQQGGEAAPRRLALCDIYLGRVYVGSEQPAQALEPLERAERAFAALGDEGNQGAALGDLANAHMDLGHHDQALATAERGLALSRRRRDARGEAAGLGRCAAILTAAQRLREAEARYQEALAAARRAGDPGLEGTLLQHLGILARAQGQHDLAVKRYQDALQRFQEARDRPAEMQTCDLLGTAEANRDQFDAAHAWYDRAEALARALHDVAQEAAIAQNRGVLYQSQALALPDTAEAAAERRRLLRQAAESVARSLELKRKHGAPEPAIAASLCQLGVLARLRGDWEEAERSLLQSLAIRERLRLPDVYKDYAHLEAVAAARGAAAQAAAWREKKEAQLAELRRRHGAPALPAELIDGLKRLCQAVYDLRARAAPAPPELRELLDKLADAPDPLGAVGRFLGRAAAGAIPAVPPDLPPPLDQLLQALVQALRGAG